MKTTGYLLTNPPGLSCFTAGHILMEMIGADGILIGLWCLWCGTGTFDTARAGAVVDYRVSHE